MQDLAKLRVVGWPRSGTYHMAGLLGFYYGGTPICRHVETAYCLPESLEEHWGVYMYRDPRDVVVSRYIQMFFNRPETYEQVKNGFTMAKFFRSHFIDGEEPHVDPIGLTWQEFLHTWREYLDSSDKFVPMRHESLVSDRAGELEHIVQMLGEKTIRREKLKLAVEDALAHRREPYRLQFQWWKGAEQTCLCGLPGEWKKLMDRETGKLVQDYCGEWMEEMGYTTDAEWWRMLS